MATPYSLLPTRRRKGFTMIELLLAIGILIVIGVIAVSNLQGNKNKKDLDETVAKVAATLREAQIKSIAQDSGVTWGVRLGNPTNTTPFFALFKSSYSAANTKGYYPLPATVMYASSSVASGGSLDITFAKNSGIPSASTTVTLLLKLALPGSDSSGSSAVQASVGRAASGKIFFDDFNRSNL